MGAALEEEDAAPAAGANAVGAIVEEVTKKDRDVVEVAVEEEVAAGNVGEVLS